MPSLDTDRPRNSRLIDWWSLTHVAWGLILASTIGPFLAIVLLTLWEPFEVLALSPFAARHGLNFGHESWRNSLMDNVFNVLGVLLAVFVLFEFVDVLPLWDPTST